MHDLLHVGHDGSSEGRADHAREPGVGGRGVQSVHRPDEPLREERLLHLVLADGARVRAFHADGVHRRRHGDRVFLGRHAAHRGGLQGAAAVGVRVGSARAGAAHREGEGGRRGEELPGPLALPDGLQRQEIAHSAEEHQPLPAVGRPHFQARARQDRTR